MVIVEKEGKMDRTLYRKYRSTSFDEIVGQEHITSILDAAVKKGTFSHAYLFTGQRGTGKTSVARILAHAINNLAYSTTPHLDIIEIDAASNRRIDDIRDLRDKVHIAPTSAKFKVYIIDEVHMLTTESFNALLKTIEEPPEHVVFILATTEAHKVPATITSRTQRFHFRAVDLAKVADHLGNIAKKEGIKITPDALKIIAEHGEGSFRDSISLLDQLSGSGKQIGPADVEAALGLAPGQQIASLVEHVLHGQTEKAVQTLRQLYADGSTPAVICSQIINLLIASPNQQQLSLVDDLIEIPRSYNPGIKLLTTLAKYCSAPQSASKPMPLSAPAITVAKKTPPQQAPAVAKVQAAAKPAQATKPSGKFDWGEVMQSLQPNPSLHSIAKRAAADYDGNVLNLRFEYSLHRKKMEDAKYKGELVSTIQALYGSCPQINVTEGKAAPQIQNAEVAAIAAIMGGGEPVNV